MITGENVARRVAAGAVITASLTAWGQADGFGPLLTQSGLEPDAVMTANADAPAFAPSESIRLRFGDPSPAAVVPTPGTGLLLALGAGLALRRVREGRPG
jgi:hypothetical protein